MKDFDFRGDDSVVLRPRLAVATYIGEEGDIVIRQDGGVAEDHFVIFPVDDVDSIIESLSPFSDLNWSHSEPK